MPPGKLHQRGGDRNAEAELLRLRAHTHTDADARRADIAATMKSPAATARAATSTT
jgi:hypothetical protein